MRAEGVVSLNKEEFAQEALAFVKDFGDMGPVELVKIFSKLSRADEALEVLNDALDIYANMSNEGAEQENRLPSMLKAVEVSVEILEGEDIEY